MKFNSWFCSRGGRPLLPGGCNTDHKAGFDCECIWSSGSSHNHQVEENRTYRLHRMTEVVTTSEFAKTRRVVLRQWLSKGRYIVVATTKQPHEAGTFILSIYTSHNSGARWVLNKCFSNLFIPNGPITHIHRNLFLIGIVYVDRSLQARAVCHIWQN